METSEKFLILAMIAGLVVGFSASAYIGDDGKSKCERVEETVKQDSNLSGAIACFEPGVIDVNRSEQLQEGSSLECVCRRSYNGNVQLWTINTANP
jgi:hypothetical protein